MLNYRKLRGARDPPATRCSVGREASGWGRPGASGRP